MVIVSVYRYQYECGESRLFFNGTDGHREDPWSVRESFDVWRFEKVRASDRQVGVKKPDESGHF